MERALEELQLAESYEFRVVVENNGARFAGELNLSPAECSLIVRGEVSGGRSHTFDWMGADELHCQAFEGTFELRGLVGRGLRSQVLQRHPEPLGHFEVRYAVSHVVFRRGQKLGSRKYAGLTIRSASIAQWVGMTTTQDGIVAAAHANTLFSHERLAPEEFRITIPGLGDVAISYQLSMGFSLKDFSIGVHFPPVFLLNFDCCRSVAEAITIVSEMDVLFSFLLGYPLMAESIQLLTEDDSSFNRASLYFPRQSRNITSTKRSYPFFPLGRNLRHDHLGLPSVPIEIFPSYMRLPESSRTYVKKYLQYRQLENPEERFLGFFRLLEKLCFQNESFLPEEKLQQLLTKAKSFLIRYFDDRKNVNRVLKQIPRWNRSKLDTASCIRKFMAELPDEILDRWVYGKSDMEGICKLRNDLTHANELEPGADEIERKAKFIEALLVIRLLVLIGVPVPDTALICPRLHQHDLITPPSETHFDASSAG